MIDVVIPVKDLSKAKQRLQSVLTTNERAILVLAMLRDLLTTLNKCALGNIWLVAHDDAVLDLGSEFGTKNIRESVSKGYNHGVSKGLNAIAPHRSVIVLPADLPLAQPQDISRFIRAGIGNGPRFAIVPDRQNRGTNGLYMSSPDLIKPNFGESSFLNYKKASAKIGISATVVSIDTMAIDVDGAEDLLRVVRSGLCNVTVDFLASSSFGQELQNLQKWEAA